MLIETNFLNMEIIISVLAILIALYTYYQSKRHNYLSVQPLASILPQDYHNKICVSLQNKGLGPLITHSIRFINVETKEEKAALIDFMPNLLGKQLWRDYTKSEKLILSPNESKTLLEFVPKIIDGKDHYDENYTKNRELIRKALMNVKVVITYSGIYNEKKESFEFALAWYGRHFTK